MYKYLVGVTALAAIITIMQCCVNKSTPSVEVNDKTPEFPAKKISGDNRYAVQIDALTMMSFEEEFNEYGLYGNGHCWAGVIQQLLEKMDPKLRKKVTFDPEADTCFMSCADEATMNELGKFIHQYFSTKEKVANVLKVTAKSGLDC